jgi:hypothetical protein
MLEAKIHQAKAAMESRINIANGCRIHFETHAVHDHHTSTLDWKHANILLDTYEADMVRHLNNLRRLEGRLKSTLDLVSFSKRQINKQ